MERAIHMYPNLSSFEAIQSYRKACDPLADKIPPHITLVFPFEDEATNEEVSALCSRVAQQFEEFDVTFSTPKTKEGEQAWIEVKEGKDNVERIHRELYSSFLAPHLRPNSPYIPHVTIGSRTEQIHDLRSKLSATDFEATTFRLDHLILEEISENEESITLKKIKLKKPNKSAQLIIVSDLEASQKQP